MKSLNLRVTIWLEERQRKKIDQLIAEQKAKSVSDLIRQALDAFLE
jgi:Arc/MetJ-type ribon-helix-helix transcriptional regulator